MPDRSLTEDSDPVGPASSTLDQDVSDESTLADLSCPWCLHPNDEFEVNPNTGIYCPNCRASIPVDQDWYRNGEKIVI